MIKARGYAALNASTPLAPFSFEHRDPEATDVVVDIEFCGICHSDIHMARNEWGIANFPVVPGHEIVGRVRQVGAKVSQWKTGQRVGVGCMVESCQSCGSCKEGLQNYCEKGFTGTYGAISPTRNTLTYGGYATAIVVNEKFILNIPEGLDPAGVAPLLCAGITTYSPLRHVGLAKGQKLGVLGLGGLGHMAVKLGASFGAEVTVLSGSPKKQEDAKRLGASHFALTSDESNMAKLQNHFDFIIDTVAAKHNLNQALELLKRQGTLIMVGASEKPLDLGVFGLIMNRRKMMGSLIGGIPETQEMLDHCGKHKITSDIEIIKAHQINEAYERTIKGDVRYRFVIDNASFA